VDGDPEPWAAEALDVLLARVDPGWLVDWDGLAADRRSRGGIRRISADDVADQLTRLLALYEQERDKLVGVARRRLGTYAQDAEDVLQEVMRKLCQHPPKLREPDKLTSYVYTSLYNETATWATRAAGERGRRAADDEPADVPDRLAAFDETVVFHIVLARALAGLSPREREMIELVDIRRLTEREAAERLGISLGAAKSYRHGARMRLREDPGLAQLRTVA
jgi:RNA polymerase sigma factor (sigma-70 family)